MLGEFSRVSENRKLASQIASDFYLFYFWPHWVFVAVHGFSLVAVSGGYSSLWGTGFSLQWFLLLQSTGSRARA